ncbi:MAG: ABC transporter ATP-binding protein [Clostridia bacterium]|nr:ABC transporter ATP-binding protein [Clostridia bacterium]
MKRYKYYIKKYWYCFLLGPLFMVIEACGEFILPFLNANIINKGASNGDISYILENGLIMLLISVVMLITGILGANYAVRGSVRLSAGIRKETFKKIQTFSFSNIDDFTSGSLITRITNDVSQIQNFTQSLLRGMFRSPVMIIGALIMSFKLNSSVAWIFLIVIPLLSIGIGVIILVSSPRYTKMQKDIDNLNINVRENVTNVRVIKSFVREQHEKEKFEKVNNKLYDSSVKALKMMMILQPMLTFAINATTLAVVWIAGRQVMVGAIELGTLTAFITYLTQILNSLHQLANIVLQGTRAKSSNRRIQEVLNAEVKINDDNVKDKESKITSGNIEFKNVEFSYLKRGSKPVLENINLKINSGEFVGIIGSTGTGKSTLVSLIPRLYDANKGEVLVDDKNVKNWSLFELRDNISVVLQKNTLFSGTIAENLRWGNENATDEQLETVCKIAQADDFIKSFPLGYQTMLGQGGTNLSGGQKQRICIARALLKKPKILILDDSTSAVDTATEAKIRKAFREELSSSTKIIIAQRINSVIDADKIVVIDDGKIVGQGKHSELINTCKEYAEIYWSQKDKNTGGEE